MSNFFKAFFLAVTQTIQSVSFWVFGLSGLIIGGILGYYTGYISYETDAYNNYNDLPDVVKSAFSPLWIMLEIFLAACAPMMFLLGVKFFLLNTNKDFKDYLFAALPLLPLLKKITGTPYALMSLFSGGFFGMGIYISLNGKGTFLMGGVFGAAMFLLALFLRWHMAKPITPDTVGDFSARHKKAMGLMCWLFSLGFYLYGSFIRDIQNYTNFIQWLTKGV